jgi:serine/threonine-protein kinase
LLSAKLGEGGMATVYRGYDTRLQVWRAVKVLSSEYSERMSILGRFEAEAQTMALLEHPNIVRVYDVGRDGLFAYIVMELVQGGSLVDWLGKYGPMPAALAISVVEDVAHAISYAHQSGVVHRDVKPHNVLIGGDGICRVTDFGIAQVDDAKLHLTKTGAVMGTWGFMAPEQRTDAKSVDGRADIYALGATLFTLLTDRMPNDLYRIDVDDSVTEGIDVPLIPLLRRACAYERGERYDTVEALIDELHIVRDLLPAQPADTPALPVFMSKNWSAPNPVEFGPDADDSDEDFESTVSQEVEHWAAAALDSEAAPTLSGSWNAVPDGGTWSAPTEGRLNTLSVVAVTMMGVGLSLAVLATIGALVLYQFYDPAPVFLPAPVPVDQPEPVRIVQPSPSPPPVDVPNPTVKPSPPPVVAPPAVKQCVEVSPPIDLPLGGRANFSAKLCVAGESEVTLHYRPVGDADWSTMNMPLRLGKHVAQVPIDERYAGGLQYYVIAGSAWYGSASRPRVIVMTP